MPLLARTVNAPLAIEVGRGGVRRVGPILSECGISTGGVVAVVVGTGVGDTVLPHIRESVPRAAIERVSSATLDEARRIENALRAGSFDAVVAVGGGGTIDVTKWVASMLGLPFVSVATNLAHDGLASPVAVLEADGYKRSFGVHIPLAVVVDLDLVAASPLDHVRAGIGDAVSNLSAIEDWLLARDANGERVDGLAVTFARSAAEAVVHHQGATTSDDFLHTLADSLILSGIAMSVAGNSRPCSGACHEISHSIDRLFPGTAPHGSQVGVGTLFAMFVRGSDHLTAVDACLRHHGLARLPGDLGLTAEQFAEAVLAAPDTRPDRYTVLEHLALSPTEVKKHVDEFIETLGR